MLLLLDPLLWELESKYPASFEVEAHGMLSALVVIS
jgi:hypothetical protein